MKNLGRILSTCFFLCFGVSPGNAQTHSPDESAVIVEGPIEVLLQRIEVVDGKVGRVIDPEPMKAKLNFLTEKAAYVCIKKNGAWEDVTILDAIPKNRKYTTDLITSSDPKLKRVMSWKREKTKDKSSWAFTGTKVDEEIVSVKANKDLDLELYMFYLLEKLQIDLDIAIADAEKTRLNRIQLRAKSLSSLCETRKLPVAQKLFDSLEAYAKAQVKRFQLLIELDGDKNQIYLEATKKKQLAENIMNMSIVSGFAKAFFNPPTINYFDEKGRLVYSEVNDFAGHNAALINSSESLLFYENAISRFEIMKNNQLRANTKRSEETLIAISESRRLRVQEIANFGERKFKVPAKEQEIILSSIPNMTRNTNEVFNLVQMQARRYKSVTNTQPNPFLSSALAISKADVMPIAIRGNITPIGNPGEEIQQLARDTAALMQWIPDGSEFDIDRLEIAKSVLYLCNSSALSECKNQIWRSAYSPRPAFGLRILEPINAVVKDPTGICESEQFVAYGLMGRFESAYSIGASLQALRSRDPMYHMNMCRMACIVGDESSNPADTATFGKKAISHLQSAVDNRLLDAKDYTKHIDFQRMRLTDVKAYNRVVSQSISTLKALPPKKK